MTRRKQRRTGLGLFGIGFAMWFAFCAALSVGLVGLIAWAIIRLVNHYT
jgi:hypothetical protein